MGCPPSIANLSSTLRPRNGARVIPDGTITAVHFVKTPLYVQVTGFGDLCVVALRRCSRKVGR